jgi:hypothetical protein
MQRDSLFTLCHVGPLPLPRFRRCHFRLASTDARLELADLVKHGHWPEELARCYPVSPGLSLAKQFDQDLMSRREIDFETGGKQYKLNEKPAVLLVR